MQDIGKFGEGVVASFVENCKEISIAERNLHCSFGEIDLLGALDESGRRVVIEVRSRVIDARDLMCEEAIKEHFNRVFPRQKVNRLKGLCKWVDCSLRYGGKEVPRLDLAFVGVCKFKEGDDLLSRIYYCEGIW